MVVCIAEKPSVAKDIARILGANQSHTGYMEGNGYQVTWTFGHLCELKQPHEYTEQWKHWDLYALPMIPPRFGIRLKDDEGIQRQFAVIAKLMQSADRIINCGDAGQEGELIQRWVMQKAGAKCPVQRLWISSLTDEAIREGFQHLKDQADYQSLYIAGLSRAIGDWLLGMNCTRLYTVKYGQQKQILSIGRVQTPTLALIVKRQQEIDQFVPEPYWVLSTIYRETTFTATKGKFTSKEEGESYLKSVQNLPFTVTDISTKKGTEAPPRLYDLTSLQVDCNRKFGYSAEQTLNLIQGLYEKKYTTYPRVDTTYLTDDVYKQCPNILQGIRGYEQFTKPLYGKKLKKSSKVFDNSKVTDHHAIIPTGQPANHLTDMERNVYDLVTRAFISVFYPDCLFLTTTVLGQVQGEQQAVEFKATGKHITQMGWRELYPKQQSQNPEESKDEECLLPDFTVGESGEHSPQLTEKQTTPPPYFTEASLLRAMETAGKLVDNDELREALKENGIGRPSTRAAIIETLFKRHYIRKELKRLIATPTGIELINIIHEELLKSAELTGIWEKKLREIERGQYDAHQFIEELKEMLIHIVTTVRNDNQSRRVTVIRDEDIKKKAKSSSKSTSVKSSTGEPNKTQKNITVGAQHVAGFQPRRNNKAEKTPVSTSVVYQKTDNLDEWIGLPCPKCKIGHIIKGRTAYGCNRWREGCDYRQQFPESAEVKPS